MRKRIIPVLAALFILACPASAMAKGMVTANIPAALSGGADTSAVLRLESRDGDAKEEKITVKNGDTAYFKVPFECPGTYRFSVTRELPDKTDGAVYGSESYLVDVYVTEDQYGKLSADPVIYLEGNNVKKDACYYTDVPEKPESEGSSSDSHADPIKTGDETPVMSLVLTWISSLFVIIFSISRIRKREKDA